MKVFVTVGTDVHPFNRLLKKIEELDKKYDFTVQYGSSQKPKIKKAFDFCSREEMEKYLKKTDLVISHAGAGSTIYAKRLGKNIVVVPRRGDSKAHADHHQFELAKTMAAEGLVINCENVNKLEDCIKKAKKMKKKTYLKGMIKGLKEILKEWKVYEKE